jgi:hypothetical protein
MRHSANGRATDSTRRKRDRQSFAWGWRHSAALEEFLTDRFVNLSIREHAWRQDDIRALVSFINDNVFDVRGWHESEGFLETECPQIHPLRGDEGTELVEG